MPITKLMEGLPNQSMNQADFDAATAKYMSELPAWGGEANALAADMNAKQQEAANSATASEASRAASAVQAGNSASSAATASIQAGIATTKAAEASDQVVAATAKAVDAAASAAASANSATALIATSTTSLVMGNGTQVLTVPAGKQFSPAVPLALVSAGAPTNKMFGTVASYSGSTLTMTITKTEGTGTFNDWTISPAGAYGPTGGTTGGQLTSALDEKKGSDLASAATIDPWSTGGTSMSLTGSATITGIANAPQAGAKRTLLVTGTPAITASANVIVKGGNVSLVDGDEIDIEAETVTKFRITVRRGDGTPTIPLVFNNVLFVVTSQVFVARVTGPHRFILEGASGSGAAVVQSSATFAPALATGGGAGGHVVKTISCNAGDSYVITLSAGGVGVSKTNAAVGGLNGNAGASASTIVGPGVSLTAGAGQGGKFSTSAGTVLGGAGGSAAGGDINVPGAAAGNAAITNFSTGSCIAATGGAANGYSGISYSSGVATANSTSGGGRALAITGGAGSGGASGAATANSNGANTELYTGGGGALGPSAANDYIGGAGTVTGILQGIPLAQVPLTLSNSGGQGTFPVSGALLTGAGGARGAPTPPAALVILTPSLA